MPYCLKSKKKSCCLNSSATAGSDNFFNSFNFFIFFNFFNSLPPQKKKSQVPLFDYFCRIGSHHLVARGIGM